MNQRLVALSLSAFFLIAGSAAAENPEFPGVQKLMSPKAFEEAGLNKLSAEERARLDDFIRRYTASTSQEAATAAVEQAVKEDKVPSIPQVIESRLVGTFTGYHGRNRFQLENGQIWAQSQQVSRSFPPVDSPPVIITKAGWGHRMYILGGGNIRVSKVK